MSNSVVATQLQPKIIQLDPGDQSYFKLLGGPPETRSIKSGLVTLSPGKSIGVHSTKSNEEVIVPLAGCGQLQCVDHESIELTTGLIAYVPPQTEHDVINTGSIDLRYIFIVAKAD
jgi:mannose-6-phosphate isomerase-like protein (cupin superfamily)